MPRVGRLLLASWLAATTLGGCARKTEGEAETPAAAANTPVGLEVENHGWSDIVVYLVRGTAEERLGTVGSLNSTVFTFPFHRLGTGNDARLKADPIGSDRVYYSEDIHIQPGQSLKWTLESDLSRSF
ncbi:MAG TPA: hypothetical protein VFJ92_11230, partial [Gemmatimonadales bacterium]|nr:hypothetical protein [Gemmatimonadales bacterium]